MNLKESVWTAGKGLQQSGLLVMIVGLLLHSLAAGDALAGAELGGRGDDALRGSDLDDRLAGFGGGDRNWDLAGADSLSGGAGDNFLETKDGERDYIDCGPGEDVASVDMHDRVAHTCETVYAA